MNSFLLLLDFYFFVSVRLCSRIGDATYNAKRVPTRFSCRNTVNVDKMSFFGDKMSGFMPKLPYFFSIWAFRRIFDNSSMLFLISIHAVLYKSLCCSQKSAFICKTLLSRSPS